jgi:hypothetical protein
MSHATTRAGRRSDLALSTVSFLVNQAYQEVAQAQPSAMMETLAVSSTTSGEARVELPSNCMELLSLSWLTTNAASAQTLLRTNTVRVDSSGFYPVAKPAQYALFNNWIELWPSPDSSYSLQVRYIAYPSDMTATTAVPSLATEWRPAVMYLSEALVHEYVGNELEGAQARARYAGYAQSLKNSEAHRQAAQTGMRAAYIGRRGRY